MENQSRAMLEYAESVCENQCVMRVYAEPVSENQCAMPECGEPETV